MQVPDWYIQIKNRIEYLNQQKEVIDEELNHISEEINRTLERMNMGYQRIMQFADTVKALEKLKIELTAKRGAYVWYKCPDCQGNATARTRGAKKNLTYCLNEKKGGNIVSLVEKMQECDRAKAEEFLLSTTVPMKPLTGPPQRIYELEYHEFLKSKGIDEQAAQKYQLGVPKGKSMLAGCIAFLNHNQKGEPTFYYGIRMKDEEHVYYKRELNPELHLYRFDQTPKDQGEVVLTLDLFQCIRNLEEDRLSISNFGLPYLSLSQFEMLSQFERVCLQIEEQHIKEFSKDCAEFLNTWHRYEIIDTKKAA